MHTDVAPVVACCLNNQFQPLHEWVHKGCINPGNMPKYNKFNFIIIYYKYFLMIIKVIGVTYLVPLWKIQLWLVGKMEEYKSHFLQSRGWHYQVYPDL